MVVPWGGRSHGWPSPGARTQGEDGSGAIQGLDLALLVHAQHDRLLRGIEVEADDVAHLGLELGIGGERERLAAPGLDPVTAPGPRHRGVGHADLGGEQPGRPVGDPEALGRRSQCAGDDPGVVDGLGPPRPRGIEQSVETFGHIPVPPLDHRGSRHPEVAGDRRRALTGPRRQHDLGPGGQPGPHRRGARPLLERQPVLVADLHTPSTQRHAPSSLTRTRVSRN